MSSDTREIVRAVFCSSTAFRSVVCVRLSTGHCSRLVPKVFSERADWSSLRLPECVCWIDVTPLDANSQKNLKRPLCIDFMTGFNHST